MFLSPSCSHAQRARERAYTIAVVALLLACPAAGGPATVGEPAPPAVSVYLNVEKDGKLVTGLTAANFRLYHNGEFRPVRLEKPEEPASIAVLLEDSQIARAYYADDLSAAIEGFGRHAPEGHWYALATYSHELEVRVDFTNQPARIPDAFFQLGPPEWREVDTYDAVYEMLDNMARLPGRRILIVLSSGFDTFSQHRLDEITRKVEASNVTIFAAGLGSVLRGVYDPYVDSSGRMDLMRAQAFLQMLASKSGGFAWFPNQSGAFPDVIRGIMQSIATQYRLVYDKPAVPPGKFHKIKVEAFRVVNDKRENFKVLVREGWR